MSTTESFQSFISWQCRLRKMSMREMAGQPLPGMSAGIHSVRGGDEQARLHFLIIKQEPETVTAEFRHIVRKTPDSREWVTGGLKILSERHYQDDSNFSTNLTALFSLDSAVSEALLGAGECHLKFKQDSIEHAFDFGVARLDESDADYQATYWHNRMFNPTLPGRVEILTFIPQLTD